MATYVCNCTINQDNLAFVQLYELTRSIILINLQHMVLLGYNARLIVQAVEKLNFINAHALKFLLLYLGMLRNQA